MARFLVIALLLASSAAPVVAAPAPAAVTQTRTLETVEVTAQRETMRKAIHSFVEHVTRFDGDNVARWSDPICPAVMGAAPEHAEFVRARIEAVARSVEVTVAADPRKCSPNLLVILSPQPRQLWDELKQRHPRLFNQLMPQQVERALGTRPVQTVQNVTFNNADGTKATGSAVYKLRDSHLRASVTENFSTVLVVVNDAETGLVTFGQLADYVALVALARVDLTADFSGADSILRLFTVSRPGTPLPTRLTDWDRSFLQALYGVDISSRRPRKLIYTTMVRGLVPE
jgi:hypothetical protein